MSALTGITVLDGDASSIPSDLLAAHVRHARRGNRLVILDRGDEIHDGQAVPLQIALEGRRLGHRDPLLVEGFDLGLDGVEDAVALAHAGSLAASGRGANRMRRKRGHPAMAYARAVCAMP